jgi:hypothetical protein
VEEFSEIFWPGKDSTAADGLTREEKAVRDALRETFIRDCGLAAMLERVKQMDEDASTTLQGVSQLRLSVFYAVFMLIDDFQLSNIIQAMQAQASLKEAESSRVMNIIILPFTIVTVIFVRHIVYNTKDSITDQASCINARPLCHSSPAYSPSTHSIFPITRRGSSGFLGLGSVGAWVRLLLFDLCFRWLYISGRANNSHISGRRDCLLIALGTVGSRFIYAKQQQRGASGEEVMGSGRSKRRQLHIV